MRARRKPTHATPTSRRDVPTPANRPNAAANLPRSMNRRGHARRGRDAEGRRRGRERAEPAGTRAASQARPCRLHWAGEASRDRRLSAFAARSGVWRRSLRLARASSRSRTLFADRRWRPRGRALRSPPPRRKTRLATNARRRRRRGGGGASGLSRPTVFSLIFSLSFFGAFNLRGESVLSPPASVPSLFRPPSPRAQEEERVASATTAAAAATCRPRTSARAVRSRQSPKEFVGILGGVGARRAAAAAARASSASPRRLGDRGSAARFESDNAL